MAREQVLKARQDRNAALVDAMVLVAVADGKVSQRELETLLRRVGERPEFEGTRPDELNALVESSALRLSGARDLDDILKSLRERLPDHKNRMLAFGLAAAVAFADRRAAPAELGLLKTFQKALGISEEEVQRVVEVVEQNGSLTEALGEPVERLYAEVMVLVSAADGKLDAQESRAVVESFAADPAFRDVTPERAQAYVSDSVATLASDGLPRRLSTLAHGLTSHAQRVNAFRLAARIAAAGGRTEAARRILDLLQVTFGLDDDEVERIERDT